MAVVYLGLGTNLGEKERNLREAVQKIEEQVGKRGFPVCFLCYGSVGISFRQ